jgi:hypothetical protein
MWPSRGQSRASSLSTGTSCGVGPSLSRPAGLSRPWASASVGSWPSPPTTWPRLDSVSSKSHLSALGPRTELLLRNSSLSSSRTIPLLSAA